GAGGRAEGAGRRPAGAGHPPLLRPVRPVPGLRSRVLAGRARAADRAFGRRGDRGRRTNYRKATFSKLRFRKATFLKSRRLPEAPSAARLEPEGALLARGDGPEVLAGVREVVQAPSAAPPRGHLGLDALDLLRPVDRGSDPLGRGDEQPVVVADDDVAGPHPDTAERHRLLHHHRPERGPRGRGGAAG